MFYYIDGTLALIDGTVAVVDCGGVGYALNTTVNSLSRVRIGERARFYVHTLIREDCFDLYGFVTAEEKRSFELLIGVSGVGPKAAQAILSANTPEALSMAVISGNEKALTVVPGIGKKIAQRILLELKDKLSGDLTGFGAESFSPGTSAAAAPGADKLADAAAALGVLGYGNSEITAALKGMDIRDLSVEDIIRQALRKMAG